MNTDDTYTIAEFTALAGFSRQWLNKLWQAGKGPKRQEVRIGARWHVQLPVASADSWLAQYRPKRHAQIVRTILAGDTASAQL